MTDAAPSDTENCAPPGTASSSEREQSRVVRDRLDSGQGDARRVAVSEVDDEIAHLQVCQAGCLSARIVSTANPDSTPLARSASDRISHPSRSAPPSCSATPDVHEYHLLPSACTSDNENGAPAGTAVIRLSMTYRISPG